MYLTRISAAARSALAAALTHPSGADMQYLSDAIVNARRTNVESSILVDANMEMLRLQQAQGEKFDLMDKLRLTIFDQDLPQLEAAFQSAVDAGIQGNTQKVHRAGRLYRVVNLMN